MPTVVTNPLSGLLDGMLQGYSLANQIKHQAMQEEAFQRAKIREQREAELRDFEMEQKIGQFARPVNGGMVDDELPAAPLPRPDGPDAGIVANLFPEMQGGEARAPFVRPNDPKNTRRYTTSDGRKIEYEIMPRAEQISRQMLEEAQRAEAKSKADRSHKRGLRQDELEDTGITVPGYGRPVLPSASDDVARMLQILNPPPPVQIPGRDVPYSPEVEDQRKRIATKPTPKIPGRDVPYSPDVEAQRKRMRATEATPGQQGVQNRFQQRQLESDQRTLRDLEAKEAKLHAEKLETGQMSPAKGDDEKAFVAKRGARLSALDLQIKGIQESKKKLIDKWQGKATPQTQAGGKMRVQLSDGQTGTIDAAEFDPKTMKKLE